MRANGVLEVAGLCVTYETAGGELLRPLRDLSLSIAAGEFVAVYGPSGSGKSTLLKVLVRAMDPDAGTVLVQGRDIADLRGRALCGYRREEVGFVQQTPRLLPELTVAQNASLALLGRGLRLREALELVLPLLERLDVAGDLGRMPSQLSAGELQRVAIAGALASDPCLVLADEPTGQLDPVRAQRVRELLAEVCHERGVATLMTTHDPQAISVATRGLMLADGALVDYAPTVAER